MSRVEFNFSRNSDSSPDQRPPHDLIQRIVAIPGVARTDSQLALGQPIHRGLADLVAASG